MKSKVIIMGAAGRDFHNYNVFFRGNEDYEVVAFTASNQIPGIADRWYDGIPIFEESLLPKLIVDNDIEQVILAYSDLSHQTVMDKASLVLSLGADFRLMGPDTTMLESTKPVISICAVRTGCGKSQTTRLIARMLRDFGLKVVIVRHPMPYGNLEEQMCQRYSSISDLERHKCTIEEREEYELYLNEGFVLYAGIDYQKILKSAEYEADVILWDGGNNDLPFFRPTYHIVVVDPLRAGDEITYYPGQANLRMADMVIINKCNSATEEQIEIVEKNIRKVNEKVTIIYADSKITMDKPELLKPHKKIIIVEDGPTITHGNMSVGAGWYTLQKLYSTTFILYHDIVINPRKFAVGTIKETLEKYPHIQYVLPAMGYNAQQIKDLEETINKSDADVVLSATPIDLSKIMKINKPIVRVSYELVPENMFYAIMDTWLLIMRV